MHITHRALSAALGVSVLGVLLSAQAGAACAYSGQDANRSGESSNEFGGARFIRTAYWRVSNSDDAKAAIVGLWKFEMLSRSTSTNKNPMPDGTLVDFGTAAWHADGTELMNSGIHNPADSNFCQGTWAPVGDSTYVLNHYALAWTNGTYTGPVNIKERVRVGPTGNTISGTFTTVVYLASVTPGHEFDQNTVLATITGTLTGTRINAF